MAKKEENALFVGISEGNELRRDVLECSKGILEALKEYERFKGLREEKIKLISQFKSDIKGLSKLINSLGICLPRVKDVGIKKVDVKVEKPKMMKGEKPQGKTEIESLEEELADIENKLNSLG